MDACVYVHQIAALEISTETSSPFSNPLEKKNSSLTLFFFVFSFFYFFAKTPHKAISCGLFFFCGKNWSLAIFFFVIGKLLNAAAELRPPLLKPPFAER